MPHTRKARTGSTRSASGLPAIAACGGRGEGSVGGGDGAGGVLGGGCEGRAGGSMSKALRYYESDVVCKWTKAPMREAWKCRTARTCG